MLGRRRPDTRYGDLPDDLKPGDIWRYVDKETGEPLSARAYANGKDPNSPVHQNLTDTMWGFYSPDGNGIGLLVIHTVRENDDGTVTIAPGDGSSNSILHRGGTDKEWHGYVDHNVWNKI